MGVLAVFEPRGTDNGARTWYHPTIHELKMMNTIALFGDEEHDTAMMTMTMTMRTNMMKIMPILRTWYQPTIHKLKMMIMATMLSNVCDNDYDVDGHHTPMDCSPAMVPNNHS